MVSRDIIELNRIKWIDSFNGRLLVEKEKLKLLFLFVEGGRDEKR